MIRTLVVTFLVVLFGGPVFACMGPGSEKYHYPSCTIPLPEPSEKVSVIYGDGPSELSDHHLGEPSSQTRLVTVHIDENDAKNYLVLSAYHQTIWQFIGDVESISRVIVLGATRFGPNVAGVVGLPRGRITFTSPDLTALDSIRRTSCTRISKACIPAQWFGEELGRRATVHPEPTQSRQRVDDIVSLHSHLFSQLDDSQPAAESIISIVKPKVPNALIAVSPIDVVSPNPMQPYEVLPGRPGLDFLVKSGALVPAMAGENKHIVEAYAEAFSARYRSCFDLDFFFMPKVDYIVMREITLPPEMPPMSLMVARGVPAPVMNGNRGNRVCLYFEARANQPVDSIDVRSNRCRENTSSRGVPKESKDVLRGAASFDRISLGPQNCQYLSFDDDTNVTVVALSDGRRRGRSAPTRRINVDVTRKGVTALFLSMEGGPVEWNISGPQIRAVFSARGPDYGLDKVILNGQPHEYARLRSPDDDCPQYATLKPNRLGPHIAQLDAMFVRLAGQGIDQLVTNADEGKGSPPTYKVE